MTAPSHAACDAFTLALSRQWPRGEATQFVRLADRLRLTDRSVEQYLPENRQADSVARLEAKLAHCRAELLWGARRKVHFAFIQYY